MAAEKKRAAPAQSTQKATSPVLNSALRRSTRVKKHDKVKSRAGTPEELSTAVRKLHYDTLRKTGGAKQVSFYENTMRGDHAAMVDNLGQGTTHTIPRKAYIEKPKVQPEPNAHRRVSHHDPALDNTISTPAKSTLPTPKPARMKTPMPGQSQPDTTQVPLSKRRYDDQHHDRDDPVSRTSKRQKSKQRQPDHVVDHLTGDPMVYTLSQLGDRPHALSLTEVSGMLNIIQDRIFGTADGQQLGFAQNYFAFLLTDEQCDAWPLHELKTKYVPLYMTTRFVADGSQYGWRNFFTSPDTRPHLVSAVLGEWFTQRIFKHTAFGFPEDKVDILENKDREYLHYDAIVRSKERAKLMTRWYNCPNASRSILDSTATAAHDLAEELLNVLHPLLPPPLFNPIDGMPSTQVSANARRASFISRATAAKTHLRATIKHDLVSIIMDCTALHKGMRLSGEDGTIIRMCPAIQKGHQFHPTAPVDCVNKVFCNETCPTDPQEKSELCIKMNCFPRVEAIVPYGPDMQQLFLKEISLREEAAANKPRYSVDHRRHSHSLSRRHSHAQVHTDTSDDDNSDAHSSASSDSFTWDTHSPLWPIVPPSLQDKEGRNPGVLNPSTNEVNTLKRASYVKLYRALCSARVYCEWTPQPYAPAECLDEAIREARKEHPDTATKLKLRVEDLGVELWNIYAVYGGLAQWGLLSTAAVVGICRALSIPHHVAGLLVKVTELVGVVARKHVAPLTVVKMEELPGCVASKIQELVGEVVDVMGPFGTAVAMPVEVLVLQPVRQMLALVGVGAGGGQVATSSNAVGFPRVQSVWSSREVRTCKAAVGFPKVQRVWTAEEISTLKEAVVLAVKSVISTDLAADRSEATASVAALFGTASSLGGVAVSAVSAAASAAVSSASEVVLGTSSVDALLAEEAENIDKFLEDLEPYTTTEAYTSADAYTAEDPYTSTDSYTVEDVYTVEDPYTSTDAYTAKDTIEDSYTVEDAYTVEDVYTVEDAHTAVDVYTRTNPYTSTDTYASMDVYTTEDGPTTIESTIEIDIDIDMDTATAEPTPAIDTTMAEPATVIATDTTTTTTEPSAPIETSKSKEDTSTKTSSWYKFNLVGDHEWFDNIVNYPLRENIVNHPWLDNIVARN